jgi:hypothetical protein
MHALQLEVVAVWAFSNTVHARVRQRPADNSIQLQKLQTRRTRQQSFYTWCDMLRDVNQVLQPVPLAGAGAFQQPCAWVISTQQPADTSRRLQVNHKAARPARFHCHTFCVVSRGMPAARPGTCSGALCILHNPVHTGPARNQQTAVRNLHSCKTCQQSFIHMLCVS